MRALPIDGSSVGLARFVVCHSAVWHIIETWPPFVEE